MKKIIAVTLFIIIMTAAFLSASAEGSVSSFRDLASSEKKPFSFRNGVRWNMTPQQVSVIEDSQMEQFFSGEWSVLIVYMFYQNALRMITYEFQTNCSMLNYQYLTGALCAVYGESMEANPAIIKGWMDRVYPDRYTTEWIRDGKEWSAEDGTYIYLYYYTKEKDKYAILYASPDSVNSPGGYDTSGL